MLAARHAALEELKVQYPGVEDGVLLARMVAYCSKLVRRNTHFQNNANLVSVDIADLPSSKICDRK